MLLNKHWSHYLFRVYLLLLVWLPLPLASRPLWASSLFSAAVALLSLGVLAGYWRERAALPASWQCGKWPLLALAAFALWTALQILAGWAVNPSRSGERWLLTLTYLQWFGLSLLLIDNRDRLRLLLYVLAICGVFQALYGGLMTLSGMEKIWWIDKARHTGVATGTFTNRNHLANYLVNCLAAGCALLIAGQQGRSINSWRQLMRRLVEWLLSGAGWLRLLLAVIVIGIVLTHSRMGNTSLFVSLTVTGLIWLWRTRLPRRHALLLIGSLLAVDTLIVGTWFGLEEVVERIRQTQTVNSADWLATGEEVETPPQQQTDSPGTEHDSANRPTVAQNTPTQQAAQQPVRTLADNELRDTALPDLLAMARANWVTGVGLGNFNIAFTAYKNVTNIALFYNEAHWDELQFLVESGLLGLLLLVAAVLYCAWQGLQALLHCRSRLLQGTGFAVTMGMGASLLHSWVEFNFQVPANAALFILMMALGIIARSLPDKQPVTQTASARH